MTRWFDKPSRGCLDLAPCILLWAAVDAWGWLHGIGAASAVYVVESAIGDAATAIAKTRAP